MSQAEKVLKHIKRRSLTSLEAAMIYGITCLPRRICDLEARGIRIARSWREKNGKHFLAYKAA